MKPSIGVLGGTGPAGSSLGLRYASLGHNVTLGSRDPERAKEFVNTLDLSALTGTLVGGDNLSAAQSEIVVVATPWDGAEATLTSVAQQVQGKIVISMANALYKHGRNMHALTLPRGSVAQHLASCVPAARIVGAFHHAPAKELGDLGSSLHSDILVCSDDSDAIASVIELVNEIPGCRGINAGNISAALAIEAMTAVLINVNIRYKTRTSLSLSGIEAGNK